MKYREAKRKLFRAGWEQIRKGATSHAIWQRGRDRLVLSEKDPVCKTAMVKVRAAIACPVGN